MRLGESECGHVDSDWDRGLEHDAPFSRRGLGFADKGRLPTQLARIHRETYFAKTRDAVAEGQDAVATESSTTGGETLFGLES